MTQPEPSDLPSLSGLPEPVRTLVIQWAADALGRLPPPQVPTGLSRVARFTPVKRARLGAGALGQAIEADAGFRAAVAEQVRSLDAADSVDPVVAAAAGYLLRLPNETELLAAVPARPAGSGRTAELQHTVRRLEKALRQLTIERDSALSQAAAGESSDEAGKLRRRLREQGTRLRQAELAVAAAAGDRQAEVEQLRVEIARLTAQVQDGEARARTATERADRAQQSLGRLRERAGQHKATADRRLDLLLSTVEGAISGLRREWDLMGGGADPAELVAERLPAAGARAESTAEPSRLNAWLGLPAAHLIVDGYNVSKTGYPDLTLERQRDRLVRALSALAARTSAEVTVVFDGAAVAVAAPPGRGIRVLFSPPGVIADDVIRDLVAAEPRGRVLVVVSSDREVAERARRGGARTAGSAVLLALLG